MYYNEKLINGLWHYKTMPRMEWKPMSIVQLTNKIAAQERELNKLRLSGVVVPKGTLCDFEWHNSDIRQAKTCSECGCSELK